MHESLKRGTNLVEAWREKYNVSRKDTELADRSRLGLRSPREANYANPISPSKQIVLLHEGGAVDGLA
jgi:hypothetical protein